MSAYLRENGLMLYIQKKIRSIGFRLYNYFLAQKLGNPCKLAIHPSAQLSGLSCISIGSNFLAGEHLRLEAVTRYGGKSYSPRVVIKDHVAMNDFVHIAAVNYVEIGNNVLFASKIYVSDHNHGRYSGDEQSDPEATPGSRIIDADKSVIIEDNVWLGEFVTVLPGVVIGRGSIIGSNSVVSRSIPPYCIAVGTPARVIKKYDTKQRKWLSVAVE